MAATNASNENGNLRHFTRELAVTLNDSELQTYGKMLAEKVREEELAEDKKKQVASEHTAKIKIIRNEIKRIADARAKGEELRPVKCAERLRNNVIEIVRLDRMEVVDTRPAELQDLQTTIPGTQQAVIPEDFDEGPREEALGGPDKTGRMVTSSVGDTVWSGESEDPAPSQDPPAGSDTPLCDACGEIVKEGDETTERDGSTVHVTCPEPSTLAHAAEDSEDLSAPASDDLPELPDDEIDRRLIEREAAEHNDPDYGGAEARASQKKSDAKLTVHDGGKSAPKIVRERSKKAIAAKTPPKKKK